MPIAIGEYRALILGSAPNWSQAVTTRIVWKTVIAESLAGYEHRMACYARPLIETQYKVTNVTARLSSYIRHLLDSRSETPVGVPVWMDGCFLLEDATEGSTTLNVSAQNRLFPWFRYALLYSDDEDYEVVRITAIQSDSVTLSSGLARDHNKLSLLVPLAFGYLKIPESKFYTGAISEFEVDFQEKLGWIGTETSPGVTATGGGPQQLDAIEQDFANFTYPPNWIQTPTQGVLDDLEYKALDRGRAEPKSFDSEKRRTFGFVYLADRYQLQSILQFFEHHRGRKGSFYIPSWTEDYVVTQSVREGDVAIPLERTGLASMPASYGGIYQYLLGSEIRLSGTVVRHHCQDIFLPEDDIENPLEPGTVLSAAIKVRLSDDTIEIRSSAPDAHELSLHFVECPHETDAPEGEEDPFQALISNATEVWVYQFHRGTQSRIFADWPYQLPISGIPGASHAQAADIRHTGCD